jgi:hypothetical protein
LTFVLNCSAYKKALRQIKNKQYSDIVKLCSDEIRLPSSSHLAEALLLRATFYLLRGETNCAMEDFEQLLSLEGVDKRVSKCEALCNYQSCHVSGKPGKVRISKRYVRERSWNLFGRGKLPL